MKAIKFIDWAVKNSVSMEDVLRIRVEDDFNCKKYCGIDNGNVTIPNGEYAVIYSSSLDDQAFGEIAEDAICVYGDEVDQRDGLAPMCIMFIKLEN